LKGAPSDTVYQVRLPIFEGPLDLLLHLMQERRLDASLVSLATITGDYVQHLHAMEVARAADVADFLMIAAQLLVVKTRFLLPPAPAAAVAEHDDEQGEELLQRLQAYQLFKTAAGQLSARLEQEMVSFTRTPMPPTEGDVGSPWSGISLPELQRLARRALESEATRQSPAPVLPPPRWLTLEECIDIIEAQMASRGTLTFAEALGSSPGRDRIVGSFLAVLHLWKQGRISVSQREPFGDIMLVQQNVVAEDTTT